jgi:hypothetical protein
VGGTGVWVDVEVRVLVDVMLAVGGTAVLVFVSV